MNTELTSPSHYYDDDLVRKFLKQIQSKLVDGEPVTDIEASTLLNLVSILGQQRNELRLRAKSAEERLDTAVKSAFYEACKVSASWAPDSLISSWWDTSESRNFLSGSPEALRPPVECAPPAHSDAQP